ncbi:MAG: DUF2723 domain-containing protein, partial [Chloroflexi bacterium]|nr:DUF2723 domain-containing protein [Chloroflexota bacterium]
VGLRIAPLLALVGALAFSLSDDVWTYATIAQTYSLNLLLIALTLWLFVRFQARRDARILIVLAFVAGLGITHHSTYWLFVPALALGSVMVTARQPRAERPSRRDAVSAVLLFLLPLALYLFIPLRGEQLRAQVTGEVLGYPRFVTDGWVTAHYLPGWANVVLGSFYATSTVSGATVDWVRALGDYLGGFVRQLGPGTLLLIVAPVVLWRRNRTVALVIGLAWLLNVLIVTRGTATFDEPAGGLHTPTYLFAFVALTLVLDALARRSLIYSASARDQIAWIRQGRTLFAREHMAATLSVLVLAVLVVANLVQNAAAHPLGGKDEWRVRASEQLRDAPANAVLIGAWSDVTPLHFLQIVEGVRADVSVVHAPLTDEMVRDMARRAQFDGRPLYLLQPSGALSRAPQP